MIVKPMSLLGSAGSNLTTSATPFSAHNSMTSPKCGAALVDMDTNSLRSASSLNPGSTSFRSERRSSKANLISSTVVSPATVIFSNRCDGSNSFKYIAALAKTLNTSANAQDHEEGKDEEKIFTEGLYL